LSPAINVLLNKAKYQTIHQRQFKPNRKPKDATGVDNEKKRGTPEGHPGWLREKPARIDRTVIVEAPTQCPYCQGERLQSLSATSEHIQEDLAPPPPLIVTKYLHQLARCSHCGKAVSRKGEDEIIGAQIGRWQKPLPSIFGSTLISPPGKYNG
jgi:hypothetical protein